MDRATRKANLKKLQLPSTSSSKQPRKSRQTIKNNLTATTNTAITNYFLTPEKSKDNNIETDLNKCDSPKRSPKESATDNIAEDVATKFLDNPAPRTRTKRTKLDAFIFKYPNDIPESVKNVPKSFNDDDLVVPEKKMKKAPKLSARQTKPTRKPRAKKQSTIKSAFFRNEQLFAEIAAQHCAADQFDGDDVQLALAISRSEAESKGIVEANDKKGEEEVAVDVLEANKDNTESIREKLKKYGFRTAEKNDYNTFAAAFLPKTSGRHPKCKWANKFTALTLRCPEKQLKKLHENIEKLLNSQFRTKPLTSQESLLPPYNLQSSLLKKLDISENKRLLQTIENVNQANEHYFVTELFEVNKLSAGYLLKDWNAIQGRDLTPNSKNKQSLERLRKLQNVYQELEEYFSSKKHLEWSIENENKEKQSEVEEQIENIKKVEIEVAEVISNSSISSKTNGNQELDKMLELITDLQKNDDVEENIDLKLNTSKNNKEIIKILPTDKSEIEDLPSKLENADSNLSSCKSDKEILKLLPVTKTLDCMHVSSCSINTQATINSTQKNNRSNSPDLFADDSDVEMEDVDKQKRSKTQESVINVDKQLSRNSSIENMESGVTTYEIFSSDEVKNTSLSKQNDALAAQETSLNNSLSIANDDQIIDLTQDDMEHSKHHHTLHNINQSKPIVEVDLFTDSPTQEEDEIFLSDVNSNSQKSKYLENKEEPLKLTPTKDSKDKEQDILGIHKEETFQVPLSLQTQEKGTRQRNKEESLKFTLNPENHEKEESFELCVSPEVSITYPEENEELNLCTEISITYPQVNDKDINIFDLNKEEIFQVPLSMQTQEEVNKISNTDDSFKFTLSPEIEEKEDSFKFTLSPEGQEKEDSFKLCVSPEASVVDEKTTENNKKEESFKLPLSLEIPEFKDRSQLKLKEPEDDDDMILREIAMNQTNTSFLNFKGSKQLETCFHKETANTNKEETIRDNSMGNDTIFRELCNKYLTKTNNTKTLTSMTNIQKTDINRTFSQILPRIKTPQKEENFTQFTMDFDITTANNVTFKRKSMSFTAKTPQKQEIKDSSIILSKSHSFNMSMGESISIDLTQNDDNNEDDKEEDELEDDCLVLSDDEINYSIWQANKTETNFKNSEQSDVEDDEEKEDNISPADNMDEKKVDVISIADNEDEVESITKDILASENSYNDFDKLVAKYITPKSVTPEELKFDRSEFGILEEHSEPEPIDFTPTLCTPAKVLNEASFLSSPSEKTAPIKRYSNCHRSSQKFQDLINNLDKKSPSPPPPYNDFDRLIYTSPLKKITTPAKKPQGIEQLLTAEISFNELPQTPQAKKCNLKAVKSLTIEKQEIKCNNKIYSVRSVSPTKPDYTKYSEAELLKELYNFGIKPLKRKQAVKMLEYIYNQTHPILIDDEEQEEVIKDLEDKGEVMEWKDFDKPSTSKEALKANKALKNLKIDLTCKVNESEKYIEKMLDIVDKKLNLQDTCGWDMLRYSMDLKAELLDENYILQTNVTKKTPQPLLPFHIAWYNLVCSNRKLHETILMYEPIDLQEIYLFLKGLGYRYDPKDLKTFFDRRCIIFRYDLTSNAANTKSKTADVNRHVRKIKKTKVSNNN